MNAAHRGALLLDQHRPGWYDRIDIDGLDLTSNRMCVLGQLYGHFGWGCWRIRELRREDYAAERYGFIRDYFAGATEAHWRLEIEARRAPQWLTAPESVPGPVYPPTKHCSPQRRRFFTRQHQRQAA